MARFVYGLDPASVDDYFGVTVHRLEDYDPKRPEYHKLPHLQTLRRLRIPYISTKAGQDSTYGVLTRDLFPRFPPYFMVVDYTMEKTFAQILLRKYGPERVEILPFNNASKNMLKQDGKTILDSGYKWPPRDKIADPKLLALYDRLVTELKQEEMLLTKAGNITFDHPQGEKNDMAISWELSIHGCLRFLGLAPTSPPVAYSKGSGGAKSKDPDIITFKDDKGETRRVDTLSELRGRRGVRINSVERYGPSGL